MSIMQETSGHAHRLSSTAKTARLAAHCRAAHWTAALRDNAHVLDANPMEVGSAVTVAVQEPAVVPSAPSPGVWRRLAARFALIAFGLFHLPLLLNNYPTLGGGGGFQPDGISQAWGRVFGQVGLWVARNVFGLTGPMPYALSGDNGDTAEEYCRLLVAVVIAALGAAIWTAADRRRPGARWVEQALWILLRYAIALGLASYAIAKIFPQQFGSLSPVSLETRVGELSPMALLWRFMEYSSVFSTFGGVMELAVVVLLCFRRTALLGALLCLPVMGTVMLMNLCYGVIVKLYAIMIVASALVLVLYDARRLIDVIILRRAVPASQLGPPFRSRRLNQARWLVKLVLVGGVIASSVALMHDVGARTAALAASPIHGTWEVESFVVAGRELAQTADPARWRRVIISRGAAIRLEDERLLQCQRTGDEAARTLELTCGTTSRRGSVRGSVRWTRDGDRLRLEGSFDGAPITATLKHRDDSQLPLLREQFDWIWDA
jgi:hypothetical protein